MSVPSSYTINYTDPTVDPINKQPFHVAAGELYTGTTLKLPGAGYAPYGEPIIEDLLHLMENFASATPPQTPTVGQIWYDTAAKQLKFLVSITTVGSNITYNWSLVSDNTLVSTTPPTDTKRLWYDTSATNPANHVLKIYNTFSATWQAVVPGALVVSTTAPIATGSLWYNISNVDPGKHEIYAFNPISNAWQPAASHDGSLLVGGIPDSVLTGSNIGGNAATATLAQAANRLATGRIISLGSGATGQVLFDGSHDVTLVVTGLNATSLNSGTVPVARLGSAGTRAGGFYLDGSNTWLQLPAIPDAFTKTEMNLLLANKLDVNGTAVSAQNVNGYTATTLLQTAYAQVGTMGKRDLYVSQTDPVAGTGVVGDVWFKY